MGHILQAENRAKSKNYWQCVKSTSELAVGSGSSNPKRKAPKINPSKSPKPENLTRNPKIWPEVEMRGWDPEWNPAQNPKRDPR